MERKITNQERNIGHMAVQLCETIRISDKANKEGCIYSTLCILKEAMPDEFEAALVTFLKYGTGKDTV